MQGSILGPTLLYQTNSSQTSTFLLMTQHSHIPLTSSLNVSRLSCYKGRGKKVQFLNRDLAHIAVGKNWLVAFNPTKTQTITISLKYNLVLPPLAMSGVQLEIADTLHLIGMGVLHC